MQIKFKKTDDALDLPTPSRGTEHSAGIDLRLASIKKYDHGMYTLGLGVCIEMPENTYGLLAVRSSIGAKGLSLVNGVGIIDSDYRGELIIKCRFIHRGFDFPTTGTRIAQIVVMPYTNDVIVMTDVLSDTTRGSDGYGSTDNK